MRNRTTPILLTLLLDLALGSDLYGSFVDVARSAGLILTPSAVQATVEPLGIHPHVTGNAVCAADVDRDGWTDLLLSPTKGRLQVFMNNRDGTFREEGTERGFGQAIDISGIAAGDFSNTGRTDVFLVPRSGTRYFLYVNDGTGSFTEEAVARGADVTVTGELHRGQGIGLVDYDRDGFLDVHITEWGVAASADSSSYSVLLRNLGRDRPGHFVNATERAGLKQPLTGPTINGFASAWADFDGDGFADLSLISDFGTSQLWWNNRDSTFSEGAQASGIRTDGSQAGIAIGDVDRDGRLDFYTGSFGANRLYRNLGDRRFEDVATEYGVEGSDWSWGAVFFDPDNDGLLDLLVTNGYTQADTQNPPLSHSPDRSPTRFFLNRGTGMTEVGASWGITDTGFGRGVTVLDYDNDGDEDILISNRDDGSESYRPWILYRNDGPAQDRNWLRLRFRGTVSNQDGYGAVVKLTASGVTQTAVYAPTNAYIGQREPVLHFGLGTDEAIAHLEVTWPNGATRRLLGVASNQVLTLIEPEETSNRRPILTLSPEGGNFDAYREVILTASAEGTPGPTYAWYKDGQPIPGAHDHRLRFDGVDPSDAGDYSVVASNGAGSIASPVARVAIDADPDRYSVGRWWNEILLDAIRRDTPNPTVHARNLYHLSAALWDAYWPYRSEGWSSAAPLFQREDLTEKERGNDPEAAQREAMSYAAYRILSARFAHSPGRSATRVDLRWMMELFGLDPDYTGTFGNTPGAVGNRIGDAILEATRNDGANEDNGYADATGYVSINPPLVIGLSGTAMANPNRWQPLAFSHAIDSSGIALPLNVQQFIGANGRLTTPFALAKDTASTITLDPGPAPQLGGADSDILMEQVVDVIRYSSMLDVSDGVAIDISPGSSLNHSLGTNDGNGHALNPHTGNPYEPNQVLRGDYARVLAEFWADGPDSETPPGHWNVIFNQVSDHPAAPRRYGGSGTVLSRLEWDVRGYLALNGAMHDAASAAWTLKHQYDSSRPISLIRFMGGLGQSSLPGGPSYHVMGLPLIPELIEVTTAQTVAPGGRHSDLVRNRDPPRAYVGRVVIRAWRRQGGNAPDEAEAVGWDLATNWNPYQRDTFVTPAFPGYVSGHSTFSRAGAEVLTLLTGDPFFPGGMASFSFPRNDFLVFEQGPSRDLILQWATYQDAADQAGISRIHGGIHIAADDLVGRRLGARIGLDAFLMAHAIRKASGESERLVNISTRGLSGPGERVLIIGFVADGETDQEVLLRAVGPGLAPFSIQSARLASDPSLIVFGSGSSTEALLENDDWNDGLRKTDVVRIGSSAGAFDLEPNSRDAAAVLETGGSVFTAHADPGDGDEVLSIQLVEAYGKRFSNLSTRGYVGTGDGVLIAGFCLVGAEAAPLLIRGLGPSLASLGIEGTLEDLELRINRILPDGSSESIASNDNWSDDARASLAEIGAERAGAYPLLRDAADAAIFLQVQPGVYTVTLSGRDATEGLGLIEVYQLR